MNHSGNPSNTKIPLVFITSSARSGSTLLDLMLDQHSEVESVGEIMYFDRWIESEHLCSCNRIVHECTYWQSVGKRISSNIDEFRLGSLSRVERLLALVTAPAIDRAINYSKPSNDLFEGVLAQSNKRIIVDSSKSVQRLRHLIASDLFDIYVIHLVRNGKAVINSERKDFARPDTQEIVRARPILYLSLQWMIHNLLRDLVGLRLGKERYLRVRYEDLTTDTELEIKRICKWLGVPFESTMLQPNVTDIHNIGGSRWRFQQSEDIKIRLDERWKNEIRKSDQAVFRIIGGFLNLRYGYGI